MSSGCPIVSIVIERRMPKKTNDWPMPGAEYLPVYVLQNDTWPRNWRHVTEVLEIAIEYWSKPRCEPPTVSAIAMRIYLVGK